MKVLLIIGLLFIFYQDMRYRAVYWLVFPVLLGVLFFLSLQQEIFLDVVINSSYNLGFLLVQFLLTSAYFSIKSKVWVNITSGYLGWGDVLFLGCIAFYLSPGNYLLFYSISLMVVLLFAGLKLSISRNKELKIPLAGMQAVLFALLLIADWQLELLSVTNDSWLLNYLYL